MVTVGALLLLLKHACMSRDSLSLELFLFTVKAEEKIFELVCCEVFGQRST
jgi:hypothetical protein